MTSEGPADWAELSQSSAGAQEFPFEFTAHDRAATFTFTLHERQHSITVGHTARLHLRRPVIAHQELRLKVEQQVLRVVRNEQRLQLTAHPWRSGGVVAFMVRQLRRYQVLDETEWRTLYFRWRFPGRQQEFLDPRLFPNHFVQNAAGQWTSTTWVRLGVPVQSTHLRGWGSGREGYVQEVARFWIDRGVVPTMEQEWDADVRALVASTLATPAPPAYFIPCRTGPFQQVTGRGRQDYRLDPDRMPEGPYFSLRTGGVEVTYSIDGRAFLADTSQSVNIVTPFLTMRVKEALLLPTGDERVTWLSTGQAFKRVVEACGLVVK